MKPMFLFPGRRLSFHILARFIPGALLLLAIVSTRQARAADFKPVELRCEYRANPLGIDETSPRLGWQIDSSRRGARQTAYRILVASTGERLEGNQGDLWDSGRVEGSATMIAYPAKNLESRDHCFWKVQAWDEKGKPSAWSEPASWSMGILQTYDWKADYISYRDTTPVYKDTKGHFLPAARQYRKEFAAPREIRRATIYSTALGIYELYLNGQRVGDALFTPGWSDYRQRAYYNTYDVTALVKSGANALGAWVADGWYSGYIGFGLLTGIGTEHIGRYTYGKTPAVMIQLEIDYTDGSHQTVITDPSWKVTGAGPIQQADLLMGEYYDARKEMPGWDQPGFDDSSWESAILAGDNGHPMATFFEYQNPPAGNNPEIKGREVDLGFKRPEKLEAFPGMPVRHIQEIKPIAVTEPKPGTFIFNLGQNFAGVVRLNVHAGGKAGDIIHLRFGEMLLPDGNLMTENLRKARAQDFYILRGAPGGETYTPRFTFHGFQYVEVTGYPGKPAMDAITGVVMHSDTELTSEFTCSDPMPNQLFKNIVWTQRANFLDLPTDCPQRDERFGWTGDAQIYVRAATYNADVAAFYTKWIRELMESQRPSGTFPGYAPFPFQHGWDFGTAWCDAGIICPWTIWQSYGDTRIIERCWDRMARFIDWRKSESKDFLGVNHGNAWGDWLALTEKTPIEYIDTVYFAYSTELMAQMADAIGKKSEAAEYRKLFQDIKTAFQKKYLKPDASLTVDTQTAYTLALFMNLVPQEQRDLAGARLARKIAANDARMGTGFLGTRPLLPVLSSVGQNDLAVRLFQSHRFPSWGYEVDQGATTIWERWNSFTKDKGFGDAGMNSFSHYSFGAVCEWMFGELAGIASDGPGYNHILIRPSPPSPRSDPDHKPIDWVKASYDSIHGRIASSWKLDGGNFDLQLAIPANTTATVYLPAANEAGIKENGRALAKANGVKFLRQEGDRAVLSVESGSYHFMAPAPNILRP